MIAFQCVHCGQRMTITEDDRNKKATCKKCGQVVSIPASEGSERGERRVRGSLSGYSTRLTPIASSGTDTDAGLSRPIQDLPTRIEEPDAERRSLTSFLAPPEAEDEIGRLGSYRILSVVGAGGMGVVFRAHDPHLDRIVAIKAMLPALATGQISRQRFLREARVAAAIQHDHVITIHQVSEDRGVPFVVMPLLRGESLDARLLRVGGPLPLPETLRIAREIAEGLSAIHELGLVHRDIKPGNVFLEGKSGRVKILDFGLARATTGDARLTQDGAIVGSPAFMAPEQASRRGIGGTTDLFSLGCILYLMTTGVLPFEADDALATLVAIQTVEPTPPATRCPGEVPEPVSDLILALLAKDPTARPTSARAVVDAIELLEQECL